MGRITKGIIISGLVATVSGMSGIYYYANKDSSDGIYGSSSPSAVEYRDTLRLQHSIEGQIKDILGSNILIQNTRAIDHCRDLQLEYQRTLDKQKYLEDKIEIIRLKRVSKLNRERIVYCLLFAIAGAFLLGSGVGEYAKKNNPTKKTTHLRLV